MSFPLARILRILECAKDAALWRKKREMSSRDVLTRSILQTSVTCSYPRGPKDAARGTAVYILRILQYLRSRGSCNVLGSYKRIGFEVL